MSRCHSGVDLDPSISYTTPNGTVQQRRPYYVTQYHSVEDAVSVCYYISGLLDVLTRLAV